MLAPAPKKKSYVGRKNRNHTKLMIVSDEFTGNIFISVMISLLNIWSTVHKYYLHSQEKSKQF